MRALHPPIVCLRAYLGRLRAAQREIELCPQPEPSRNTCTEKADAPEPQTTVSRRSPDFLPISVLVAQRGSPLMPKSTPAPSSTRRAPGIALLLYVR